MESDPSVSCWIRELRQGDQQAAQQLWEHYFQRLVRFAEQRLPLRLRRVVDDEDVALSAFKSFYRGIEAGRYPQLADRDDLWRLLVTITARKAIHLARHVQRQKRGGRIPTDDVPQIDVADVVGNEPTPEFCLEVAEELELRLTALDDSTLKSVALWKMEGYTNEEIAAKLDCTLRTVERKLRLIRQLWEGNTDP
jgi:DNA-directed RNA polymerase specialized sigma24 family protein